VAQAPHPVTQQKSDLQLLCEAQLREIVRSENKLLCARIERLHRSAVRRVAMLLHYYKHVLLGKLERWLVLRVRGEAQAIDTLAFVVKQAIERASPLHFQLRLEGEDLFVDKDLVLHPLPEMPESGPFEESLSKPHTTSGLSFSQLNNLMKALQAIGSSGRVLRLDCERALSRLASVSDRLQPNLALNKDWQADIAENEGRRLAKLMDAADPTGSGWIDWCVLLMMLALPSDLSSPSQSQLSVLSQSYESVSLSLATPHRLPASHFARIPLWFETNEQRMTDMESMPPLKEFLLSLAAVPRDQADASSSSSSMELHYPTLLQLLAKLTASDNSKQAAGYSRQAFIALFQH